MKDVNGYRVIVKQELKELDASGYLLEHEKTKAKVVAIEAKDDNKVFSIGFRTPPKDSTGVAHIVEHTVPVKDPFIELEKGSLNTFLNAMTYPDKTVYPVASCNEKDFRNLMNVYLDAVFYPNIYQEEKIFQQEGWHYNYARWNSQQADGIDYWETGQVTPSNQFIVLTQAAGTNPTWIANTTGGAQAEGSVQAGGVSWELRSLVDAKDKQKVTSYYIGQLEGTTVILSGEAEAAEFQALAEATAAYLKAPASTVEPTPASGIR